jgi:hypothetical protein
LPLATSHIPLIRKEWKRASENLRVMHTDKEVISYTSPSLKFPIIPQVQGTVRKVSPVSQFPLIARGSRVSL